MRTYIAIIMAVFAALLTSTAIINIHSAALTEGPQSAWFAATPKLENFGTLSPSQSIPYSVSGNRDCATRKLTNKLLAGVKTDEEACVTDTAYGGVSTRGELQRQGTEVAGRMRMTSTLGPSVNIIPVPQSNTLIYTGGTVTGGSYMFYADNASAKLSSSHNTVTGLVTHVLKEPGLVFSDQGGNPLPLNYDSMSFSRDGEWLVADSPFRSLLRINIKTREVVPFGQGFNYNSGDGPNAQTAITSNGRYAAVASTSYSQFDLYDMSTCGPTPQTIAAPLTCQKLSLWNRFKSEIPNFSGISTLRFISDDALSFYASSKDSTGKVTLAHYVLYTGDKPLSLMQYLGLGDSFSSGEGAYDYKQITDTDQNRCHLSQRSYPYLIGASLDLNSYNSVACSGAILDDIHDTSGKIESNPQAKGKKEISFNDEIYKSLLPGYRAQVDFVPRYKPQIITLSAVGNDLGFSKKIKRCVVLADTCYATYEDRLEVANEVNSQFYRLSSLYRQLKQESLPSAKIYAVGYPKIIKENGNCAVNVNLNEDEATFANQLTDLINDMVKRAALNAGVYYVDIADSLVGLRLCETTADQVAVNGLTAGDDTLFETLGQEGYHPNARGQNLMAQTIMAKTNNLSAPMPQPDTTSLPATISPDIPFLVNMPKTSRALNAQIFKPTVTQPVLSKDSTQTVQTEALFAPTTNYQIWLHSDPVKLTEGTTSASGDIQSEINIPSSVPPGVHTLHIYGQNVLGHKIDVYSIVEVADPGSTNPCGFVPASNQDVDHDGIDDACDGDLASTPTVAPDTTPPVVTGMLAEAPNAAGWHNKPVTIKWSAYDQTTDGDQPLASPEDSLVDQQGEHEYQSSPVCDAANNCALGKQTAKLDSFEPTIFYSLSEEPGRRGWHKSPVTVTFECTDQTSGITECTSPVTVTAAGTSVVTGKAVDVAGNISEINVFVSLDETEPHLNYAVSPSKRNGWHKGPLTVSFSCYDPISGIDDCTPPQTLDQEGANQWVDGHAVDQATNERTAHVGPFNIDKTMPTLTYSTDQTPNQNGWYSQPVTVRFHCHDQLSGINFCATPVTVSQEGITAITGYAEDVAGNRTETVVFISLDMSPPEISMTSTTDIRKWLNEPVTLSFLCHDSVSPVADCPDPITITEEGNHDPQTVTAIDSAGNTASVTSPYLQIDKTTPQLGSLNWNSNPKSITGTATLSSQYNDNLSGVMQAEYYIGDNDPGIGKGATMQIGGGQVSVSFGSDFPTGVYRITVRIKDAAGNWSQPSSHYLVVYDPTGGSITGKRAIIPSVQNGDSLPFFDNTLFPDREDDKPARFAISVKYDRNRQVTKTSDFQFSYHTGSHCKSKRPVNCHSLTLNATKIDWFTINSGNPSTGTIAGEADVIIDGALIKYRFKSIVTDTGPRQDRSHDTFALELFPLDQNIFSATPTYKINETRIAKGNIKIRSN